MKLENNLLPIDGEAYFMAHFFDTEKSNELFDSLLDNIRWKHEPVKIMGKEIMQPRLTAWYGDEGKSYSYTGINMMPSPWNDDLRYIRELIEKKTGLTFNSALLNQYRDGNDSVGWHRDNESSLGVNPIIASVSFGTSRVFSFKHHKDKKLKEKITLTNGSLLLMMGETQHRWLHSIQKDLSVAAPRINITFRTIKD